MTMKRPWIVIACAAFIVTLAMGVRQAFGLFLPQMSISLGIGRESFGLAIAISNLVFGLAQPFIGALGDRHGAGPGRASPAPCSTSLGLLGAAWVGSAARPASDLRLPGRRGAGRRPPSSSCSARSAGWCRPSGAALAFGIVTAGGSLGQFLVVPGAQLLLDRARLPARR